MKLDLSEIVQNVGNRQKYVVDEPCDEMELDGVRCLEHITGEVEFANTGSLLLARGRLQGTVELECSRCLVRFQMPVSALIEEEFTIPIYQAGVAEVEEAVEEVAYGEEGIFVDNIFDISELVRQALILAVPIRPLCSEGCKGLCSQCGKNLNIAGCDCPEVVDSPLAGLAELLQTREQEE